MIARNSKLPMISVISWQEQVTFDEMMMIFALSR
jgi:hypothetical protein